MNTHLPGNQPCCVGKVVDALGGLVRQSYDYQRGTITEDTIEKRLTAAKAAAELDGHIVDAAQDSDIIGRVSMEFTVRQDEAERLLGREAGHESWLPTAKAELFVRNGFWDNYRRLLESRLPDEPRNRLDEVTDQILDSLEPPSRSGQWDRRGLVIGQVQSGKTNNYTGLVCKAADAGYKLIIVLAGTHNNLRAQTQFRIDEGLTGRDTRDGALSAKRIGVGLEKDHGAVFSLTSATEGGDFKIATANQVGFNFTSITHPTVFVIKKNVSVLETIYQWIMANAVLPDGHERIADVPVLMIDDEADNASIDTANTNKDPETDPTRTNLGIRRILNSFDQTAYVGYTATPFANIFINTEADHDEVGEELFPRDFIFSLRAPSNYVGPERIFGVKGFGNENDDDDAPVPLVSTVDKEESENWIPPKHRASLVVSNELFPESLNRAIRSFVLSCAASRARGQSEAHRTMLVHVTQFKDPQEQVRDQVADRLIKLKNAILFDEQDSGGVMQDLRRIWETDFVPASLAVKENGLDDVPLHSFDQIAEQLASAVAAIEVRMINGNSADTLAYYDHPRGLSTIVIGGAKLSRGLTLEGLVVSYYLRSTRMYDTLMQMGRWFGYRPGYLDLCRVYTTADISSWYRSIATATNELFEDLAVMQSLKATPAEFGLRVRTSPGMMVTSQAKMRNGLRRKVSYSNSRPEVTTFDRDALVRESCLKAAAELVDALGTPSVANDGLGSHWTDVSSEQIMDHLLGLAEKRLYQRSRSFVPKYLAEYIKGANEVDGLTSWTVVLKSSSRKGAQFWQVGSRKVGLAERKEDAFSDLHTYSTKSLIGSSDESLDLTEDQKKNARIQQGGGEPYGSFFRLQRPRTNGLLIIQPLRSLETDLDLSVEQVGGGLPFIGYCLSLPKDPAAPDVTYIVNNIFDQEPSRIDE